MPYSLFKDWDMIAAELIGLNTLTKNFHRGVEQLTGYNPAQILQTARRPKAEQTYPLAYFKLFLDKEADTSDVRDMLGFLYIQMLCVGPEMDMAEVTGWHHGLRCTQRLIQREGIAAVIFAGDGEQWRSVLINAPTGGTPLQEWGGACHQQLARYNMDDLFGRRRSRGTSWYLEFDN